MKNSVRQVLILGCGDLGSRVGSLLSEQSAEVIGVKRQPPAKVNGNLIQYHAGDAANIETFAQFLTPKLSHILVSLTPDTYSEQGYKTTYFDPLRLLINKLKELSLFPTILFVSSTSVYAQNSGEIIDELSVAEPQQFNGYWLRESEKLIETSNIPYIIARLSGIYGASRRRLLDKLIAGQCESPQQMTNRVHIDDAARAIVHLFTLVKPENSLFCVTDDEPVTHRQIILWLQSAMKFDIPTPEENAKITGKIILNHRLRKSGFTFNYPSFREGYGEILQK